MMKNRIQREVMKLNPAIHYRHIAFVLRGGAIQAVGLNITRHAEVAALLNLYPSDRYGTKVVSIRVRKDGSFANAKPCKKCEAYMRLWRIKKVTWTDSNGVFHTERYR